MNRQSSIRLGCIVLLAIISLAVGVLAAPAQNVPATAREAAASPQFAPRLAHPSTPVHRAPMSPHPRWCSRSPQGAAVRKASPQDNMFYANGPVNGICDIQGCTVDAWTVNFGFAVSDTIGASGNLKSFNVAFWVFPGDKVVSLDWAAGTYAFGSDLGQGTASVSDQYLFSNEYGYEVHQIGVTGLNASISTGNWLTLQNAVVSSGNPVYWDENAGPSQAEESSLGTIPSESFNAGGGGNACMPEQQGNFKVIHDFSGKDDGANPSGVVIDKAGNLYGSTQPPAANGSVFKLWNPGSGWLLNTLYNFVGGSNGTTPQGVVLGPNGIVYGAVNGGMQNCKGGYCGSIFNLKPFPTACLTSLCSWMENALYSFTGTTDAWGGSNLVSDQAGNLYGVSGSGGAQGKGAIFELAPSAGGWVESIVYTFIGGSGGASPTSLLVGNDGNLYGMTASDGANGNGVVFQLIPSANGWTEAVIYDIQGAAPWSKPHSLVQDSAGNLYGEYEYSPCCGNTFGLIFMLTPGSPKWAFTELRHGDEGYFGADVFNTLTIDGGGNLYGTGGGFSGCIPPIPVHGYIFELTRDGDGWHYSTPVYWDNTDFSAVGDVALDPQGNLYGTTIDCGTHQQGTVWQLKAAP